MDERVGAVRCLTVFAPLQRFSCEIGTTLATHNEDADSIDIYFAAASASNFVDPYIKSTSKRHEPALWVGFSDGADRTVPSDGRVTRQMAGLDQTWGEMLVSRALHDGWWRFPPDYEFLSSDPAEVCPEDRLRKVRSEFHELD